MSSIRGRHDWALSFISATTVFGSTADVTLEEIALDAIRALSAALLIGGIALPVLAADDLLIENVTLVSPERARSLDGAHVLVRGGRIARVSPQPLELPASIPRLDGTGKYLTPV